MALEYFLPYKSHMDAHETIPTQPTGKFIEHGYFLSPFPHPDSSPGNYNFSFTHTYKGWCTGLL